MVCFFLCFVVLGSSTFMVGAAHTSEEQLGEISAGKPDLIIEKIVIKPGNIPYTHDLYCQVKNTGDANANGFIDIKSNVYRYFFGVIPMIFGRTFTGSAARVSGLKPGDTMDIPFAHYSEYLPTFGFFKFFCEVNPHITIDESAYNNNYYSEKLFVIFGDWS